VIYFSILSLKALALSKFFLLMLATAVNSEITLATISSSVLFLASAAT